MRITDEQVYVHYNGWPARWDEWLPIDSDRIAPFRTKTLHTSQGTHLSPCPAHATAEGMPHTGSDDVRALLPDVYRMMAKLQPIVNRLCQVGVDQIEQERRVVGEAAAAAELGDKPPLPYAAERKAACDNDDDDDDDDDEDEDEDEDEENDEDDDDEEDDEDDEDEEEDDDDDDDVPPLGARRRVTNTANENAPMCSSGRHAMVVSAFDGGNYAGNGFCCDTCERPGMHGTERWFCATCTSDICFECVSRDGVAALRLDAWPADERAAHVSQSQLLVEEGRLLAPLFDRLGRMYVLLKKC